MMRLVVYAVAVLAAAGIVYYMGNSQQVDLANTSVTANSTNDADPSSNASSATEATSGDVQLVSLKVPGMHCPFACYPSVKKTLEGSAGVQGVDLVEQKEEGTIDNPVVIIKASKQFNLEKAVADLAASGFADAEVVQ